MAVFRDPTSLPTFAAEDAAVLDDSVAETTLVETWRSSILTRSAESIALLTLTRTEDSVGCCGEVVGRLLQIWGDDVELMVSLKAGWRGVVWVRARSLSFKTLAIMDSLGRKGRL